MNDSTPRNASGSSIPEVPNRAPGQSHQAGLQDDAQHTEAIPTAHESEQGDPRTSPIPVQPRYGQYGVPQAPQNSQSPYSQAYSTENGDQSAEALLVSDAAAENNRSAKRFTAKSLVGGMVLAGLLGGVVGGGAVVGVNALTGNSLLTSSSSQVSSGTADSAVVINNPENVTAVTAAAAKASPSVVTIEVSSGSTSGSGSGVILDKEGHILTNTHVVTLGGEVSDPQVTVQLSDGQVYSATVVGTDPLSDLAVIKIDAENLTPVEIGDSSELNVGDTAIAIGAPLGLSGTVTDGIVSTLNRTISVQSSAVPEESADTSTQEDGSDQFNFNIPGVPQQSTSSQGSIYLNVIQTDAAINQGNSGGALVDVNGKLIGINVAIASSSSSSASTGDTGNIGVGFSIPVDYAQRVAQEIIDNGEATHALLGVTVQAKASVVNESNTSFSVGAEVAEVSSGSAAEKAGLQSGDVIVGIGERVVSDSESLTAAVREFAKGDTAKVTFERNGQEQTVDVTFEQVTEAN
ncbi:putative serine protease PepD [Neomicrococcus aestuarii]|uniref:Putative serine protease PepD n=1 Tax=Neomicrococcus aestuarii TaxID=556325 RepID=A0A7W8X0Y3_9MICC|nr:trypsin-like peptidase domain-containing protein [Neomicrococcus aestuarii]MBB5513712.1 putative serine protease PepD [Neomicrococcus aestuarii]